MKVFRNVVAFVSRLGLCVLFVAVCGTQERCPDRKEMGFDGICVMRNFRRKGCLKVVQKRCMGCVVVEVLDMCIFFVFYGYRKAIRL